LKPRSAIEHAYDLPPETTPVEDGFHIDATHLTPFAESHNGHPTNGPCRATALKRWRIAVRKIHWHACHARLKLNTVNLKLFPEPAKDPAFHPDRIGLEWRRSKADRLTPFRTHWQHSNK
jgi:hypothetical protein